jgi:hypothetical protein
MLRDNLVGLIEPMPTPREKSGSSLALGIPKQRQVSDDRSSCLENPRPEGAESALTERLLLHFRLNQDTPTGAASEKCLSDKEVSDDIWLVSFISFCPMSSSTFPWLCGHPANAHRRNQSLPNQEG